MVRDLIARLKAVLAELEAEGNRDLAGRVAQAILELERSERPGAGASPAPQSLDMPPH